MDGPLYPSAVEFKRQLDWTSQASDIVAARRSWEPLAGGTVEWKIDPQKKLTYVVVKLPAAMLGNTRSLLACVPA